QMLADLGEELNLGVDLTELAQLDRMLGGGVAVTLHPPDYKPRPGEYDYAVPLGLFDFNRYHNPEDRGPRPTLARNPMVRVTSSLGDRSFTGDWLLDTGAAASIISTAHAQALGLIDADGNPLRPRTFTLPLGGIGGDVSSPPGFVLDT